MNHLTKTVTLIALTLALAANASAGVVDGAGKWAGQGSVFNLNGDEVAQYGIEVVNTPTDAHSVSSEVTITLADGSKKLISQTLRDTPKGFSIESSLGNGGGYYFGEGMVEMYVGGSNSHGYATTLVMDGPDTRRMLRTELQDGKAIQFFREKLARIQ